MKGVLMFYKVSIALMLFAIINSDLIADEACECENWRELHPEWIFCDDFETEEPMVGEGRYFEYGDNGGDCVVMDSLGLMESRGVRVIFQQGEVGAGGFKLAFGRNPSSYMNSGMYEEEEFREIYYRMYLKMEEGWQGSPAKLSRATVFHNSGWAQAMIAHLWSDSDEHLLIDPATSVDENGVVRSTRYNDFENLRWLGYQSGKTKIFSEENSGKWFCVEMHVKLNDPGESNGVQEFWIDGELEARREGLNFVGTYTDYSINAIFFENYWNEGSPKEQERYFDNIVVSRSYIGPVDMTDVDEEENSELRIYPNPASEFIRIGAPNGGNADVRIYDLMGNEVLRKERMSSGEMIGIRDLSEGVYFCRIIRGSDARSCVLSILR
jgi:hypothetical protein